MNEVFILEKEVFSVHYVSYYIGTFTKSLIMMMRKKQKQGEYFPIQVKKSFFYSKSVREQGGRWGRQKFGVRHLLCDRHLVGVWHTLPLSAAFWYFMTSQICALLAVWPWASYSTFLCLSFTICKMRKIIALIS